MRTSWWMKGMLAASACLGLAAMAWSQAKTGPTVAELLTFKPLQQGIVCGTPTPQDMSKCKVEALEGGPKGTTGWVLRDPKGLLLRKFSFSNGAKQPDQWSYYKDGVEVYREIDTNA